MKRLFLPILLFVALILFGFYYWSNNLKAVDSRDRNEKMFVINPGSGSKEIATNLKKEGLIKNSTVFFLFLRQSGLEKKIQAGDFRLSPSMTAQQIAKSFTQGSLDIWVTIPEGKRSEEIAELLKAKFPGYNDTWETALVQNEGNLFPDTYLIPKDATIDNIISLLTQTFDQKYAQIKNTTSYSKKDIIIVASLVEREARHDEDRPLIASVIYNRLGIGMALQIDATIQYAKGTTGNWWGPVSLSEYKSVKSSYNTYLSPGLPPGPIANPGLKALQAAANPADTDYIYYITDKNGINRYAKTLEQHEANKEKYGL